MNKISTKVEELISNFSFEELTVEQRSLVLSEMTQQDYVQLQSIVAGAAQLGELSPALPSGLQGQLRQQFRQRQPRNSAAQAKSSIISAALEILLGAIVASGYFWFSSEAKPTAEIQSTQVFLRDTIYLDKKDTIYVTLKSEPKIITKEIIKYVERKKTEPSPALLPLRLVQQSPLPLTDQLQQTLQGSYFNNINFADVIPTKVGKPIGEEGELMNLLTEMPSDGFE